MLTFSPIKETVHGISRESQLVKCYIRFTKVPIFNWVTMRKLEIGNFNIEKQGYCRE